MGRKEKIMKGATLPFKNLNRRGKFVLSLRLITAILMLISISILLGDSYPADQLYVARMDCARADLANGFINALQSYFKIKDTSITTSEINLLAKYTETKIKDTPEVIYAHLRYSCYEEYSIDRDIVFDGVEYVVVGDALNNLEKDNVTVYCSEPSRNYAFDYRQELSEIGQNIILSFAYDAEFEKGTQQTIFASDLMYQPSAQYTAIMDRRKIQTQVFEAFLATALGLCLVTIVMTLVYYSNRGDDHDDSNIPVIWKHGMGVLSSIILFLVLSSCVIILSLMRGIQANVKDELSTFGIHMHLGSEWFGVLSFTLGLSVVLFALWGGSIWCNRSVKPNLEKNLDEQVSPSPIDELNRMVGSSEGYSTGKRMHSIIIRDDDNSVETDDYDVDSKDIILHSSSTNNTNHFSDNPFEVDRGSEFRYHYDVEKDIPLKPLDRSDIIAKSPIMVKSFFPKIRTSPLKNQR